LPASIYI